MLVPFIHGTKGDLLAEKDTDTAKRKGAGFSPRLAPPVCEGQLRRLAARRVEPPVTISPPAAAVVVSQAG